MLENSSANNLAVVIPTSLIPRAYKNLSKLIFLDLFIESIIFEEDLDPILSNLRVT